MENKNTDAPDNAGRFDELYCEAVRSFPGLEYREDVPPAGSMLTAALEKEHWHECFGCFNKALDEWDGYYSDDISAEEREALRAKHYPWTNDVYKWTDKYLKELFLLRHPVRRTRRDAAWLCADLWVSGIFNRVIQDNGDRSEHGGKVMMLGSMLKSTAMEKITPEQIAEFRDVCASMYCDFIDSMSVDYGPDRNLHNCLFIAGIPKDDIDDICPWKTHIKIDPIDYTVIEHKYDDITYH